MLIHKPTMACLAYVWDSSATKLIQAFFRTVNCLDNPADWLEVEIHSQLGLKAMKYYPDMTPVYMGDRLVDVIPATREKKRDMAAEQQKHDAQQRGYAFQYKKLPSSKDAFSFADSIFQKKRAEIVCADGLRK